MVDQVEISSIDLRYEGYRLRSVGAEKALLLSISAQGTRLKTNTFYAQANLLSGGILRQLDTFTQAIRQFHDRSRQT